MKIIYFAFSPTRTSAAIAAAVAEGMASFCGAECVGLDVTYDPLAESDFPSGSVAVIAAPVYGGRMAPLAKERLKGLRGNGAPCVLIAVYGNRAFENALADMAEFAAGLGFTPVAAGAFVGEHSYSTESAPIAAGRPDNEDFAVARRFGAEVGRAVVDGSAGAVDVGRLTDEPSPEESLVAFRKFVAEYMQSRAGGAVPVLPEVDIELCSGCGLCQNLCPVSAIGDDCRSVDASKCIRCSACVKGCPSGARRLLSPFAPVLSANFNRRKNPVTIVGTSAL